ncbi:MAG TPA: Mut7-C RNAse domain-containing protein [Bacteroidales bacterium]|nr:Mut7-C RNAse domain-containing protein [Bacteroidales bacterium]HPT12303.1 Mut7-C RNAse domain-containing protein [Bacteroidales bacterium]
MKKCLTACFYSYYEMNYSAKFRFYEELNDFLPAGRRKVSFTYSFSGSPTVKDAIEAIGIPHVEVDMILLNGSTVDFSYRLKDNDDVSVYPVFESFDISSVTHLREKPLRDIKFIADVHLGKLARYLRFTGFDTIYRNDYDDIEIISLSQKEQRVILTRDKGILRNRLVTRGYWLRSQDPIEQIGEVISRFDLKKQVSLFSRCSLCNSLLTNVKKDEVKDMLLPKTVMYYDDFKICTGCNKIYWQGTHCDRLIKLIEKHIK